MTLKSIQHWEQSLQVKYVAQLVTLHKVNVAMKKLKISIGKAQYVFLINNKCFAQYCHKHLHHSYLLCP